MIYFKDKKIPYYYLYDERGSEIFDEITKLKEYYPFQKEQELINTNVHEMIEFKSDFESEIINLVEFGAGYSDKTEVFISLLLNNYKKVIFIPIDISESACIITKKKYDNILNLEIRPYVETYEKFISEKFNFENRVIYIFLGGSIGNFETTEKLNS